MGLRDDIQSAVSEAFDEDLNDVVASFSLLRTVDGSYDSQTGTRAKTTTSFSSRGVFGSFGAMEIDGTNIKSEDEKLIVNGSDISIDPKIDDVIELENGTKYLVIKPNPVMGGGTIPIIFNMQIRKNA